MPQAIRTDSLMTPEFISGQEVLLFRESRGLTREELGTWLGIGSEGIVRLETFGASRMDALALSAIDHGLRPWRPTRDDRIGAMNLSA